MRFLVELFSHGKVFLTGMTSLGPYLLLLGRNMTDLWRTQNCEKYRGKKKTGLLVLAQADHPMCSLFNLCLYETKRIG